MSKPNLLRWVQAVQETSIDLDGYFGPQCMDLVNAWMRLNGRADLPGNAIDVPAVRRSDLQWVQNQPQNFPRGGDIVCFAANTPAIGAGPYGHVSVAVIANAMTLISIDQNWGGISRAHLWAHSYVGVLGWLHLG